MDQKELTQEEVVNSNNQLRTQLNMQVEIGKKMQNLVGEYAAKNASLEVSFTTMKQHAQSLEEQIAKMNTEKAEAEAAKKPARAK